MVVELLTPLVPVPDDEFRGAVEQDEPIVKISMINKYFKNRIFLFLQIKIILQFLYYTYIPPPGLTDFIITYITSIKISNSVPIIYNSEFPI
jgi:hypothetical protein